MKNPKSQSDHLARIGAFFLLFGTVAVLVATLLTGFFPTLKAKAGWPAASSAYSAGESIDLPVSLYGSNNRTVVVFASATCGASVRSGQLIAALAESLRHSQTKLLVITPNTMKADQQSFVQGLHLRTSESLAMDLSGLRLKSVPTFVLVDERGTILRVQEGTLDEAGRAALVRAAVEGLS